MTTVFSEGAGTVINCTGADVGGMPSRVTLKVGTDSAGFVDNVLILSIDIAAQNRISQALTLSGDLVTALHPGTIVTVTMQALSLDGKNSEVIKKMAAPKKLKDTEITASLAGGMQGDTRITVAGNVRNWKLSLSTGEDMVTMVMFSLVFTGKIT